MAEVLLEAPEGDDNLIMSHSEVDNWNDCTQKWDYSHRERLEPAELNERIRLGTIVHTGLEIYYKGIAAGGGHEESIEAGEQAIADIYGTIDLQLCAKAIPMIRQYHKQYGKEAWHVKYVEQEFYLYVTTTEAGQHLWFAIKPDLIVQEPLRNGITVVDHKAVGRFYDGTTISTSPQMVRYAHVLSQMGMPLHRCIYNQLHSAPAKTKPKYVERAPFQPTYSRSKTTWDDTVKAMLEIAMVRASDQNRESMIRRQPGAMKCKFCLVEGLCTAELNGTDASLMRRVNFKPSTYGYGLKPEE